MMVELISAAADKAGVNLFRRFDLMRALGKDGIDIDELDPRWAIPTISI